jgi:hypothetical protein
MFQPRFQRTASLFLLFQPARQRDIATKAVIRPDDASGTRDRAGPSLAWPPTRARQRAAHP